MDLFWGRRVKFGLWWVDTGGLCSDCTAPRKCKMQIATNSTVFYFKFFTFIAALFLQIACCCRPLKITWTRLMVGFSLLWFFTLCLAKSTLGVLTQVGKYTTRTTHRVASLGCSCFGGNTTQMQIRTRASRPSWSSIAKISPAHFFIKVYILYFCKYNYLRTPQNLPIDLLKTQAALKLVANLLLHLNRL